MFQELLIFFGDLTLLCLVLSVLIVLYNYKRLSSALRVFSFYLIFNLILEALARVSVHYNIPNYLLVHVFTLFEFILLSMFYGQLIKGVDWFRRFYPGVLVAGSLFIIINSIYIQPPNRLNTYAETLENIVLIIYAITFFYNQYLKDSADVPQEKVLNLINSGILIYISGSLFIFMFGDLLAAMTQDKQILLWAFNAGLNLLFKIIVLIAMIRFARLERA